MEKEKFKSFLLALSESIDIPNESLKDETKLVDIDWDSLAVISCIALVDEYFNVTLTGAELDKAKTIKDIFNLISTKV